MCNNFLSILADITVGDFYLKIDKRFQARNFENYNVCDLNARGAKDVCESKIQKLLGLGTIRFFNF